MSDNQLPPSLQDFKVSAEISKNHRFASYKLVKEDKEIFYKSIVDNNLIRDIENEIWFNLTLKRLREANPDLPVRAPEIYEFGQGWYASEYIKGQPLLRSDISDKKEVSSLINRFADLLVALDLHLAVKKHDKPIYESTNSAPYSNLLVKVDKWMEEPLRQGLISSSKLDKARNLIEKYKINIYPSLQHGDFVPWHILTDEKEEWVLVDGEHSSLIKPRFYDLAYLHSRLYTKLGAHNETKQLLKTFIYMAKMKENDFLRLMYQYLHFVLLVCMQMPWQTCQPKTTGKALSNY